MKNKFRNTDTAIKAGDLLLIEQPFAFVLSAKEKGVRCDNCLQKSKVLKCSGCQFVHYCGRLCQKDAWNDHKVQNPRCASQLALAQFLIEYLLNENLNKANINKFYKVLNFEKNKINVKFKEWDYLSSTVLLKWECANLKRVSPKVIPDAARMLAKIVNRLSRGDGHSHRSLYSATSFRMWKDLMSHYSDLKADRRRMEHFTSLCGVLIEFLKDISLPNTVELMGIYGRMVINSFTLLDLDMHSIGTGIYLASSILDHSCNPNAVATFDGKTINIRATMDMPYLDWNQIRISYIDLMKTPYERQTELLANYYFLCQCDRCLDEMQLKLLHGAKCLNSECDNPVTIPWKENCQLVRKPEIDSDIGKSEDIPISNGECKTNCHHNGLEIDSVESLPDKDGSIRCDECGTKYTNNYVDVFVKTMEFTEMHIQNMEDAAVSYVDVCKYCLERQEGILHPLNVMHAQTLDHAFDALILVQQWEQACVYAERLIPCFKLYYGERHPLLGILHLKYGKILLYKMDVGKALSQLKFSEKILKITHGEQHPLYREQLLPLLRQAVVESSSIVI